MAAPYCKSVLLIMSGTALGLSQPAMALFSCVLGIFSAALTRRLGRRSSLSHAAPYLWEADIAGGLTSLSLDALLASVRRPMGAREKAGGGLAFVWLGARSRCGERPKLDREGARAGTRVARRGGG